MRVKKNVKDVWTVTLKQVTRNMLGYFDCVKNIYEQNPGRITELQTEISDIQHILGLNSHDAVALVKLAKELKRVLQERWKLKDELKLAKPIYELFDKHSKFFEGLHKLSHNIDEIVKTQENRTYVPRIRTDLQPGLIKQENNVVKLKKVMEMRNAR